MSNSLFLSRFFALLFIYFFNHITFPILQSPSSFTPFHFIVSSPPPRTDHPCPQRLRSGSPPLPPFHNLWDEPSQIQSVAATLFSDFDRHSSLMSDLECRRRHPFSNLDLHALSAQLLLGWRHCWNANGGGHRNRSCGEQSDVQQRLGRDQRLGDCGKGYVLFSNPS